jgi:thioredoxin 1
VNFLKFLQNEQRQAETKDDGKGPRALTAQEFDRLTVESQVPVVVDFWAEWCGPCHMLAPSVDQLAREYEDRAVVGKLNADDYPEILERYGIMGIPTLLYFQGGRVVDKIVGVNPYGTLKNKLERLAKA